MQEIVSRLAASNVKELIQNLQQLTVGLDRSTVYTRRPETDELKLALVETTLTDGSTVYDVVIS